jgi:glutamate/tyrosine decarboxylase-like PLP-dependent enzyme
VQGDDPGLVEAWHEGDDGDGYAAMAEQTLREREELAEELRNSWTGDSIDPLPATLEDLRAPSVSAITWSHGPRQDRRADSLI